MQTKEIALSAVVTWMTMTAGHADTLAACQSRHGNSTHPAVVTICQDPRLRGMDATSYEAAKHVINQFSARSQEALGRLVLTWLTDHYRCEADTACLFRSYATILTKWWDIMLSVEPIVEPPMEEPDVIDASRF